MRAGDLAAWLPLLALLATMPLFAALARGRPRDADVARRPASVLLGYWLRDWMVWVLSPLEGWLVRRRVSPDVLNYAGAVLGLGAGVAFISAMLPLAAWLVALGGICDIIDGRIARARDVASPYGEFLDSTLDRFGEMFTYAGVAWYFSGPAWRAAATTLAIGSSLLVSYTRARGEALGVTAVGGFALRAERLVLLAVAALFDAPAQRLFALPAGTLLSAGVVTIALGSLATALYRTVVIAKALRRRAPGAEQERGTGAAGRG